MSPITRVEESRPCIAWCYERCNKPDQSQILKEMTAIAKDLRSNFVCKKKANSFVQWWLRAGMPWTGRHTVIFADWREAKPLLESLEAILLECGKSVDETLGKLIHVCIIAQSPKIYQRAMEWTKAMNRQVKVLSEFSARDIRRYAQDCLEEEVPLANCHQTAYTDTEEEEDWESIGESNGESNGEPIETGFQQTLKTAQSLSLLDLMQAVKDPFRSATLEKLIKETMVQVYED